MPFNVFWAIFSLDRKFPSSSLLSNSQIVNERRRWEFHRKSSSRFRVFQSPEVLNFNWVSEFSSRSRQELEDGRNEAVETGSGTVVAAGDRVRQADTSSSDIRCGFFRLFKRGKSDTIVLSGLSGSGKTTLFYQLRDGLSHEGTVTSMEPNEGRFVLHSESTKNGKVKPVHLVDVPGHSRLRPKLEEFLPQAAGVVFIVDALEFLPNLHAVSEYLYDILTNSSVVKKKVPVLICCNKSDKVTAHSKEFIRKQLEKEIDKLRASRSGISEADIANEFMLGTPGVPFSFSQCSNKVTVAESSGLTGETSQVEQFIREHVKP